MARVRRGEEAIEPAIERRRGDHGNKNGGHRGDDGEQADDLHVQPRARVTAPARPHHQPNFPPDNGEQEEPGGCVAKQKLDDDLVDRRDRGQPRKDEEGGRG